MHEDEPFLRAILADPDDRTTKLVYADWLDDRGDPRAEFLRLQARLMETPRADSDAPALRERLRELQASLPSWWLATVGGLHATSEDEREIAARINEVARVVGRQPKYTTPFGYTITMEAGATCGRTGAVAYLESTSRQVGSFHDISYALRLRSPDGQATSWEPETYNPYFGCRVKLLEWFGDAVLFIYREKHRTYAARVGFDHKPNFREIADYWVLDGRQVAYIGWRETEVRRVAVPQLEELPRLSVEAARERGLLPRTPWGE